MLPVAEEERARVLDDTRQWLIGQQQLWRADQSCMEDVHVVRSSTACSVVSESEPRPSHDGDGEEGCEFADAECAAAGETIVSSSQTKK